MLLESADPEEKWDEFDKEGNRTGNSCRPVAVAEQVGRGKPRAVALVVSVYHRGAAELAGGIAWNDSWFLYPAYIVLGLRVRTSSCGAHRHGQCPSRSCCCVLESCAICALFSNLGRSRSLVRPVCVGRLTDHHSLCDGKPVRA